MSERRALLNTVLPGPRAVARPTADGAPGMGEPEPEQIDMDRVYLSRFYQHNTTGMDACREWGVATWSEDDWNAKYDKILSTYKKKAKKAAKKGATGPEADYQELLYGALLGKYAIDPRTLPPAR